MKNCKGKAPAFQFYVKDWLSDPELQKAHPTTRGIWINLLCYMWDAPDRGKLETNERELCQLGSCLLEDIKVFLSDAKRLDFCDISVTCHADVTSSHADVTIKNRRMIREQYERQKARERKQKQRDKEFEQKQIKEKSRTSHGNVTPPSPTPTPTPTPNSKPKDLNISCSEPEKSPDSEPEKIPILKILLIKRDGEFSVFQEDVDQWQETFPRIDALQILRRIKQWNFDNPKKRKTKDGIRKHISSWMEKEQDKGGKTGNQSSQIPKATTVYQADMLQKEAVNQEYLRQRRQDEESNSRHQDVVDIENNPRAIN
ncbi:MAG: hypothetical protein KAS87_05255 [Candidatus Omnitrophica bacterium]|nr:hypothetical protein [Candidatus Omnitrophota bacterium]